MDVEKLVREYIDKMVHMSLGTCKDGRPWVCEVHFAYDDALNLYFRSLKSRRHSQEIAGNPRVAGNIVRQHELGELPVGVYFEGTAEMLAAEDRLAALPHFSRLGVGEEALTDAANPDGHQFYKITVENYYVFGKFDTPSGQKYQLAWNGGAK